MISWRPFIYQGVTYDLSHLHPQLIEVVQAAAGDKPAKIYHVQLIYSLHTFTRGVKGGDARQRFALLCPGQVFSNTPIGSQPLKPAQTQV